MERVKYGRGSNTKMWNRLQKKDRYRSRLEESSGKVQEGGRMGGGRGGRRFGEQKTWRGDGEMGGVEGECQIICVGGTDGKTN